jgi:phosphoenolpyruvate carboxykinase (GTP)
MDFLVVPLGTYLTNHLRFGQKLRNCPRVFSTNYFLKHRGAYTNAIPDKKVWILWAEGRVHGDYDAIKTPIGYLPKYRDLKELFKEVFEKDYSLEEYHIQFSVRLDKHLEKISRMEEIFKPEPDMPKEFWEILNQLRAELEVLKAETEKAALAPEYFL